MPELPEVETIARGVHERLRGDRILEVWFSRHSEPFKTSPARQAKGLSGKSFLAVHRTGKHIVCELGSSTNNVAVRGSRNSETQRPTAQWIVHLGMSGRELRFVDPRRFGRLEFRNLAKGQSFDAPGSDPLAIGADEFAVLFRGRKL